LVGELHNPTPYDYPAASTFGPHGQHDVAELLRHGAIAWVLCTDPIEGPLRPSVLVDAVAACSVPVDEVPGLPAGCVLRRVTRAACERKLPAHRGPV
jgi:hypothetical protein